MSRREQERKKSLDALARIAWQAGGAPPLPKPKPEPQAQPRHAPPPPSPTPPSPPPARQAPRAAETPRGPAPAPPRPQQARRKGDPLFEGRAAKQEEARLLRERRERELARSAAPSQPLPPAASSPPPRHEDARRPGTAGRGPIDPRFEGRAAKQEEARLLRERRERELAGNTNLQWRGMSNMGVPASIRRTGFDRVEPNVTTKISDILGEAKEKEGRLKNRDRGRRQGGGRGK